MFPRYFEARLSIMKKSELHAKTAQYWYYCMASNGTLSIQHSDYITHHNHSLNMLLVKVL